MSAWQKEILQVRDVDMAYVDAGAGDTLLFLHGNPTSSWLWRNILPELTDLGRCVAPDLIGMGDSGRLRQPGGGHYDFATHSAYLDGFITALGVTGGVTLVLHDWGSALGFDWARRHRDLVSGIVYMEALVMPLSWEQWPEPSRPVFEALRSPAGEAMILDKNIFIERILPASMQRKLTADEMNEYRRPYFEAGDKRWPMLDWPRQLPLAGEPPEVCARVQLYADWLAATELPKLFINAEPGAILVGDQREFCRTWKNQTEVTVPGIHFIQEDSPAEIVAAIRDWYQGIH